MGQEIKESNELAEDIVTIVLPAYNEEAAMAHDIDTVRAAMDTTPYKYEIIVVDDCSTDNTASIAEAKGVRVIRHEVNRGTGASRKTGFLNAKGNIVVTSDADGTYPHHDIPKLLEASKDADMVVGARTTKVKYEKFYRTFPKYCIRKLASFLAQVEIPDLNSGLRVFKKHAAIRYFSILPQGHSWEGTITLSFLCNGHRVKFVPIDYYKRKGGRSSFKPLADTYSFIVLVVRTVMYFNPLRALLPLSILVLTFAGVKIVYDWFTYHDIGGLDVMLIVGGLGIAMVGFLADLLIVLHKRNTPHV